MVALFCVTTSHADDLPRPTNEEATEAVLEMMQMPELAGSATAKLGTCIPALEAEHPQQIACTVSVMMGAGSSETQADFYRQGQKWKAQPSVSQDELPFPDPAL
ncbi:hypothetical protein K5Q02_14140 [Pseudomonas sp. MM211]|nr:hypothetical protein K5Q02_14140 [Pseudomonas sp. MM211]